MNKTAATKLAGTLRTYAGALRGLGILGALGAGVAGYFAGTVGLSQFERDMDMGWHMNAFVGIWWSVAVISLLQTFWCALISDAVAVLLEGD
jgi:hypothetical protein